MGSIEQVMVSQAHWESVYGAKQPTEVSWYRPHLDLSLRLIEEAAPRRDAAIIDVGGGESTLVDDVLDRGYTDVTVLDIAAAALDVARKRLRDRQRCVEWLCGDITAVALAARRYDVWHDRAVFHFLTQAADRAAYVRQVARALKPGGHVLVATFGPEGPVQCSGLDVVRYDAGALHREFGAAFRLVKHWTEQHRTPAGALQQFTYCYCHMPGSAEGPARRTSGSIGRSAAATRDSPGRR